jgi:hypothetical protein
MGKKHARREQYGQYQEFRRDLGECFTETDQALGPPDLSFLDSISPTFRQTGTGRHRVLKKVAAAAILAVVLGVSGFITTNSLNRRSVIRAEASRFTEALFNQPLFGDGASEVGDLLIGADILSELVLPVPQAGAL